MTYEVPEEIKPNDTPDPNGAGAVESMRKDGLSGPTGRSGTDAINTGNAVLGRVEVVGDVLQVAYQEPATPRPRTPGGVPQPIEDPPAEEAPQLPDVRPTLPTSSEVPTPRPSGEVPTLAPLPPGDAAGDKARVTKDDNGLKTIEQPKHNFTLTFGKDAQGKPQLTTSFKPAADGSRKPDQVYTKDEKGWYYHGPDGKPMRMQGDFRVDENTGAFTQVLRKDIDGADGAAKETTRTMDAEGNDIVSRMDGTASMFKYDASGKKTEWAEIEWVEKDKLANLTVFTPFTDDQGRAAWRSGSGEIRYDPKIEDNGNLTYKKPEDLGKDTNQVVTSSGDRMLNGENGVKYDFNYRGDVSSIRFPSPRLFEGQRVNRIDIGYRDVEGNQGQIIDSLGLFNEQNPNLPFMTLQRLGGGKPTDVYDQFNAFDGQGRQLVSQGQDNKLTPYAITRDIAIRNGLLSVSEHLPTDAAQRQELIDKNPNIKSAIDTYKAKPENKGKPEPKRFITTYKNSLEPAKTGGPKPDEYEIQIEGFSSADTREIDIFVPGEAGYKMNGGVPLSPTPKVPDVPIPSPAPTPEPSSGRPAVVDLIRRSRNLV